MENPGAALPTRTFPTAQEDAEKEGENPIARYQGPESSYRLAFTDTDFLLREELRPVRMQLERSSPSCAGRAGVRRHRHLAAPASSLPSCEEALEAAQASARARRRAAETATRFALLREARALGNRHAPLASCPGALRPHGGGPESLKPSTRSFEVGGRDRLNLVSRTADAHSQHPPEPCSIHYFAAAQMHFLMRALALCAFPAASARSTSCRF